VAERKSHPPGPGGPIRSAARYRAHIVAPRQVRGALAFPANDNPLPPALRRWRLFLMLLATAGLGITAVGLIAFWT
jgi:hypothetical protein